LAVKVKADGKEIVMNDFVAKFIEGTVVGGVGSLKGVSADWKKIEIEITRQ
jgi:hypothetical protein